MPEWSRVLTPVAAMPDLGQGAPEASTERVRPGFRDMIVTIPGQDAVAYLDSADFDVNPLGVPIVGIGRGPLTCFTAVVA